jgi:predicted AlkP superfamily pyrophosphatase or phosphodiesterase
MAEISVEFCRFIKEIFFFSFAKFETCYLNYLKTSNFQLILFAWLRAFISNMFHFVPHKGVTLEIGLAVIFWPYWLANDFRDFPFTP